MSRREELLKVAKEPTRFTVLESLDKSCRKVFKGDQKITERPYRFKVEEKECRNIKEFAELFGGLQEEPKKMIIRGRLKPGVEQCRVLRRLENFEKVPQKWLHVDVDKFPSELEPETWAEWVVHQLPAAFHDVSYVWQFSSSAGVSPGINLHLWFFLVLPADKDGLKRWYSHLDEMGQRLVDDACFRTVQPQFTAPPLFVGRDNPLPERWGLVEKKQEAVPLVIPAVEKRIPRPTFQQCPLAWSGGSSFEQKWQEKLWCIESSGRLHVPILQAFSVYKWMCERTEVEPDPDGAIEAVRKAIEKSGRDDKEEPYMTDRYLQAQYESANSGTVWGVA